MARIDARLEEDTVWLTQAQISELFQRDRNVITKHINNIFKERELDEKGMCIFCTLQIQTSQSSYIALI